MSATDRLTDADISALIEHVRTLNANLERLRAAVKPFVDSQSAILRSERKPKPHEVLRGRHWVEIVRAYEDTTPKSGEVLDVKG